jgi:hypothetical protein
MSVNDKKLSSPLDIVALVFVIHFLGAVLYSIVIERLMLSTTISVSAIQLHAVLSMFSIACAVGVFLYEKHQGVRVSATVIKWLCFIWLLCVVGVLVFVPFDGKLMPQ